MLRNTEFPNTFLFKNKLVSLNAVQAHSVYAERLINFSGKQYREWNVMRSKLGAGIKKGFDNLGINNNSTCLYLGAASGTTVSHVSDMLDKGYVFAVEFSAQPFSKLLNESKLRNNIIPILSDANKVENYAELVPEVDFVFQDISQKNQVYIFVNNMNRYMKKDGFGYLSLKCKSIDVTRKNKEILDESELILKENGFIPIKSMSLAPFEKDHYLIVVQFNDSPNKVDPSKLNKNNDFDRRRNFNKGRNNSKGNYNRDIKKEYRSRK